MGQSCSLVLRHSEVSFHTHLSATVQSRLKSHVHTNNFKLAHLKYNIPSFLSSSIHFAVIYLLRIGHGASAERTERPALEEGQQD